MLLAALAAGCLEARPDIAAENRANVALIEARLALEEPPADIATASDAQVAAATAALVDRSRGPSEQAALVRAAVTARAAAALPVVAAATARASELGLSEKTIGSMLSAALQALRDQGLTPDTDAFIGAVAGATGLSEADVIRAASPEPMDLSELIKEEVPTEQDESGEE